MSSDEFSDQSFVFTELLTDEVLANSNSWHRQPIVVQKRLVPAADVRVVAIEETVFGARAARPGGTDWRKDPTTAEWIPFAADDSLRAGCKAYLKEMGLRYAAFDFVHAEGELWFLEANQAGEWLFLDRALGLGIGGFFASYLSALARGSR